MILLLSYKHFYLAQCCLTPTANPAACCCPTAAAKVFAIHHLVNFFPACGTQGDRFLLIFAESSAVRTGCQAVMWSTGLHAPSGPFISSGPNRKQWFASGREQSAGGYHSWCMKWTSIQDAFSYQMIQVKDVWSFSYSQSLLPVPFQKNISIYVHACKI